MNIWGERRGGEGRGGGVGMVYRGGGGINMQFGVSEWECGKCTVANWQCSKEYFGGNMCFFWKRMAIYNNF